MARGDATAGQRRGAAPPRPRPLETPVGGVQFYSPFYAGKADKVYKPEGLTTIPPLTTAAPFKLEWGVDCDVLGMYLLGCDPSGALSTPNEASSRLALQLDIQGRKNFITDGISSVFLNFGALCHFGSPWFPTRLKAKAGDTWLFTVKNLDNTYTLLPEICLAVRQRKGNPFGQRPQGRRPDPSRGAGSPPFGLSANANPFFQGGANWIVKPQNLITMRPGTTSGPLQVQWPIDGMVQGLYLNAWDPSNTSLSFEAYNKLQIQLDRRGETVLVSNGQAGDFASFAALCPQSVPYFPLRYQVKSNEHWLVTLRNVDLSLVQGIVPEVAFSVYSKDAQ